ncbi:MAG: hypothetical protein JRI68_02190 [Deltaproteobacteria bacterium]|nr:hypothetical protein [Deltaproteobacteria bacterium]
MPTASPSQKVVVPPPPPSVPPPLPEAALTGHRERRESVERDAVTDTQLPSLEALQSFAQVLMSKQEVEPPSRPKVEWISPPVELDSLAATLSAALGDDDPTPESDRPSSPPTVRTVPPPERVVEARQWSLRGPLGLLAAAAALATVLIGSVVAGSVTGPSPAALQLAPSGTGLGAQATQIATWVEDRSARGAAQQLAAAQASGSGTIVASATHRTCQLWIAGTPYGKTGTARASVPAGEHIVACRLPSGQTLLRRVYVEGGDTLYESF